MQLHKLPKLTQKDKKRLGRGHGSGKVKTSGRGTKGQKARRDIPLHFEGGALTIIKRLPFLRGKGRNKHLKNKPVILNLEQLNSFPSKSEVSIESLAKANLVSLDEAKTFGVKILGSGELKTSLKVMVPVSRNAKEKIEKSGGSVVI